MGQYHVIYNKTKKEYFSFGGAKLWEKVSCTSGMMGFLVLLCNSNNRGNGDLVNPIHKNILDAKKPKYEYENAKGERVQTTKEKYEEIENALKAVQGHWAGDEVVIQGDYAKKDDPAFISNRQRYKDITNEVIKALKLCFQFDNQEEKLISDFNEELKFRGNCGR